MTRPFQEVKDRKQSVRNQIFQAVALGSIGTDASIPFRNLQHELKFSFVLCFTRSEWLDKQRSSRRSLLLSFHEPLADVAAQQDFPREKSLDKLSKGKRCL